MDTNRLIGLPIKNIDKANYYSFTTKFIEAKEGDAFTHEVVDLYKDRQQLNDGELLGLLKGQPVIVKKMDTNSFREDWCK
jgi:hypothetical protein